MASWCPDRREAEKELGRELDAYLAAVNAIREELLVDPTYTNEGEWLPEEVAA